MISFDHEGKHYEVSAMSEFQRDLRNHYLVQLGVLAAARLGLSSLDSIPASLDKLCADFINWHLCTTIDGEMVSLLMLTSIEPVLEFADLLSNDETLYKRWKDAYQQTNQLKRDAVTEKNVVAPVSELETSP